MERLPKGTVVFLSLMSADARFQSVDKDFNLVLDKRDVGTGIVLASSAGEENILYQIAVIDGRFDAHRNDLGELWVNDFEVTIVEGQ
jgi:hypothetical protein